MRDLSHRLIHPFPVTLFSVVMGLAGLTIAYERAVPPLGLPAVVHTVLLGLVSAVFALVLALYALKVVLHPKAVLAELQHPIKLSFFATIPISFLLVSIAYHHHASPAIGEALWFIGAPTQLLMVLTALSRWIRHDFDLAHANPAWFIPIVGTLIVPVVGVDVASPFVAIFFFSIGMFFWLVFFTIILYRLIFHVALQKKSIPTLFIFIPPPAVGLVSYYRITGGLDLFAYALYSLTLFFLLLLLSMGTHFRLPRFFISWWAYTFPLAASAIASLLVYRVSHEPLLAWVSGACLVLATLVVARVAYATLKEAWHRKLLVED